MFNISKKIGYALFTISLIVIGLWACTKKQMATNNQDFFPTKEQQSQLHQELQRVNAILASGITAKYPILEYSSIKSRFVESVTEGEDIVFFNMVIDKKNNNFYSENHKVVYMPDFFFQVMKNNYPPDNPTNNLTNAHDEYTINCLKDKDSWEQSCSNDADCIVLLNQCSNENGCGTVCRASMAFIPKKITQKYGSFKTNPQGWSFLLNLANSFTNFKKLSSSEWGKIKVQKSGAHT